ncbi:hypothetical protein ABK040_001898 [Willaertia magna]
MLSSEEEPSLKKRKVVEEEGNNNKLFFNDVIFEITKYIDKMKDYFNFAKINKTIHFVMTRENLNVLNKLFKRNRMKLKDHFPEYLFNVLNYLSIDNKSNIKLLLNFTQLKVLDIKLTKISDNELKGLTNLEKLKLENCNKVYGKCFLNLKQLKTLKLTNMYNIKDESLVELKNLNKLTVYQCTLLTGDFLKHLQQLTELNIKNERFNIENLNSLINLKVLFLQINKKHFINYNFLHNLTNLETLSISPSKEMKDDDLMNLKNLKTLELLNECNVTGSCFINLNNLESFLVCFNGLKNLNEENLKYLTKLTNLDLSNTKISGEYLKYLINLKMLSFVPNKETFKEEYLQNLSNNLESLCLNKPYIKSNFSGIYLNQLINLKELDISNTNIEDKYLINLNNLKSLTLNKCEKFTGECFLNLINLTELNIYKINISEIYLNNLINLKILNFSDCNKIIFGKFLLNMNNLQQLTLYHDYSINTCKQINEFKSFINQGKLLYQASKLVSNKEDSENEDNEYYYRREQRSDDEKSDEGINENVDILLNELTDQLNYKDRQLQEKDKIIQEIIQSWKKNDVQKLKLFEEQFQKKN